MHRADTIEELRTQLVESRSDSERLAVLILFEQLKDQAARQEVAERLQEAVELARKTADPNHLAAAGVSSSEFYRDTGDIPRSLECAELVRQAAAASSSPKHRGQYMFLVGRVNEVRGDYRRARECYESCLKEWRGAGYAKGVGAALNQLGSIAANEGNVADALCYFHDALKIDDEIGDPASIATTKYNLGWSLQRLGRWDDAESCYRAMVLGEQRGMPLLRATALNALGELFLDRDKTVKAIEMFKMVQEWAERGEAVSSGVLRDANSNLGLGYFRLGDYASAQHTYDQVLDDAETSGDRRVAAVVLWRMAELALEQGQLDRCRELAERSLGISRDVGLHCDEAQASRVLAMEYAARGNNEKARESFEQALTLLRDLTESLDLARVRFHYGRYLLTKGDRDLAVSLLGSASEVFKNLGVVAEGHEVNRLLFQLEMGADRDLALLQGISGVVSLGIEPQVLLERAVALLLEALKFDQAAVFARGRPVMTVGNPDSRPAVALGESQELVGTELVLSWPVQYGGKPLGRIYLQRSVPAPAVHNYPVLDTVANLLAAPIYRLAELAVAEVEERPALAGLRYQGVLSRNQRMVDLLTTVCAVAGKSVPVLVRGESGTGKELIARALHDSGARADRPFVAINCAAVPENLLEAEFFGIEKGTATGVAAHKGKFEIADGGTVFLDEIGDMSPALQSKVLRVLQEKTFERVGGHTAISVDVRVVAATNQPIRELIAQRKFREDLYYRLNTVELLLPSLSERPEDIPELVRHFVRHSNQEFGRNVADVSPEAMSLLTTHRWLGNIRELQHVIERAVLLARGETIQVSDLPPYLQANPAAGQPLPADLKLIRREAQDRAAADVERAAIADCLEKSCWNVQGAAKLAGYSRAQFYRLMQKYSISRPQP